MDNSRSLEPNEANELDIHLAALTAKTNEDAIEILKTSNSNASQFFQALFYANIMSADKDNPKKEIDFARANDLMEQLQKKEPQNASISFYQAIIGFYNRSHKKSTVQKLSSGLKQSKYFNKYWENMAKSLAKSVSELPVSYKLLSMHLYSKLSYPTFHWPQFKTYIHALNPNEQFKLGRLLMSKSIQHSNKSMDQYWSPIEHQIGRNIIKKYFESNLPKTEIPKQYTHHYMELEYIKKLNNKNYDALWKQVEDPNQPCPIDALIKYYR